MMVSKIYFLNDYLAYCSSTHIFRDAIKIFLQKTLNVPEGHTKIFKESALGRLFHRVAMSVYISIYMSPFYVIF